MLKSRARVLSWASRLRTPPHTEAILSDVTDGLPSTSPISWRTSAEVRSAPWKRFNRRSRFFSTAARRSEVANACICFATATQRFGLFPKVSIVNASEVNDASRADFSRALSQIRTNVAAKSTAAFALVPVGAPISFAKACQRALTCLCRTVLAMTAPTCRHPSMFSSPSVAPSRRMAPTSAFAGRLPNAISGQSFCPLAARLTASQASALSMSPFGNSTEWLSSFTHSASTLPHSSIRSRSRSHHGLGSPLIRARRNGSIQRALIAA